jgi:PIN domain nuclease of toxin-antitoxin system
VKDKKIPKISKKKKEVIKMRAQKLYNLLGSESVMPFFDDETNMKPDFATLSGPKLYTKYQRYTLSLSEKKCLYLVIPQKRPYLTINLLKRRPQWH